MSQNLIIKLARLANNNPNENEANLAARKVCKLLADNNFAIFGQQQAQPKQGTWSGFNWSTRQWDWYNEYTKTPPKQKPPSDPEQYKKHYENPLKRTVIVWCKSCLTKKEISQAEFHNLGLNNYYYCPDCRAK